MAIKTDKNPTKKTTKKTTEKSPSKSPKEQVLEKYKLARSVNIGDKCMIVSKKTEMKDYKKYSISAMCEDSAGAWKMALHRML